MLDNRTNIGAEIGRDTVNVGTNARASSAISLRWNLVSILVGSGVD